MNSTSEPDLIVTKPTDVWLLTDSQIADARKGAKFWRTRREIGKRSVTCRDCGEPIVKGPRLFARHVNIASRTYDITAYLHTDLVRCAELKIEHEYMQWQGSEVEAFLADPHEEE